LCHRDVGDVKPDPVSIDRSSTAFKPFTTFRAGFPTARKNSTAQKWHKMAQKFEMKSGFLKPHFHPHGFEILDEK